MEAFYFESTVVAFFCIKHNGALKPVFGKPIKGLWLILKEGPVRTEFHIAKNLKALSRLKTAIVKCQWKRFLINVPEKHELGSIIASLGTTNMSFLGDQELKVVLPTTIVPYEPNRIDAGKYELSLGDHFYASDLEKFEVKSIVEGKQFVINPGQFALLITKEKVKISKKHIGFISIKAGIKFMGLVNISGFHVDPGFEGNLKFSVYNAGSNKINLTVGQPFFQLWLSEITSETEYKGSHQGQTKITSADLNKFGQGDVASPSELSSKIDSINKKLNVQTWFFRSVAAIILAAVCGLMFGYFNGKNISSDEEGSPIATKEYVDSLITEKISQISPEVVQDSLNQKANE